MDFRIKQNGQHSSVDKLSNKYAFDIRKCFLGDGGVSLHLAEEHKYRPQQCVDDDDDKSAGYGNDLLLETGLDRRIASVCACSVVDLLAYLRTIAYQLGLGGCREAEGATTHERSIIYRAIRLGHVDR